MPRLPDLLTPAPIPSEDALVQRRRRIACAITVAIGATFLAGTLGAPRGSTLFFVFGGLAAVTWLVGAYLSGPLPLRRVPVVPPLIAAAAAFGLFLAADLIARRLPLLSTALHRVLGAADAGPVWAVLALALVSAVAEEVFFRGALLTAFGPRRAGLYSTLAYGAVTVATLNAALVLAALIMGALWARERMSTRSVVAPALTHAAWSALMLLALPR